LAYETVIDARVKKQPLHDKKEEVASIRVVVLGYASSLHHFKLHCFVQKIL
jgi:hypothetical protein